MELFAPGKRLITMRRVLAVAILAGAAIFMAETAGSPPGAKACSIVGFSPRHLPDLISRSPVIAIGTWTNAGESEVTLVVDDALKGTEAGASHKFDNRDTYTAMACSPYDEPFRKGYRFKDGERSLVFMEKQLDGLWQIGWLSLAAFDAPADELAPLAMWPTQGPAATLAEARMVIAGARSAGSGDAAMEAAVGCEPPHGFDPSQISDYTPLATAVVIVTVISSPPLSSEPTDEPVRVRVDEVLRGVLKSSTVSLNDRWISDYESRDCQPKLESGRHGMRQGQSYLVFLRPDEFGIAEFRPAAWGKAAASVNERFITNDQPTLAEIRKLTGTTSAHVDGDAGRREWPLILAGTVVGLLTVMAAGAAIRSRKRGR